MYPRWVRQYLLPNRIPTTAAPTGDPLPFSRPLPLYGGIR